jgi:Fe2+ or Zn2+ uptake regulation protein
LRADRQDARRADAAAGKPYPLTGIETLQRRIAEKLGFRLVDHRMELYGVALDRRK